MQKLHPTYFIKLLCMILNISEACIKVPNRMRKKGYYFYHIYNAQRNK